MSVIGSLIFATWILSNKIGSIKTDLTAKIAVMESTLTAKIQSLQTELAVMKKSEEGRDEKIAKMWEWWLKSLEQGWTAHMKTRSRDGQ